MDGPFIEKISITVGIFFSSVIMNVVVNVEQEKGICTIHWIPTIHTW